MVCINNISALCEKYRRLFFNKVGVIYFFCNGDVGRYN